MEKKKNILFVANKNEIGGATKSMIDLIKELNYNYLCDITVITPKKGKVYNFCIENNIKVIKTMHDAFLISEGCTRPKKIIRHMLIPFLYFRHIILNYISIKIIEKNIDLKTIDIIHTNIHRDDIGGIISRKYKIPHIVHIREFSSLDYKCISLVKDYVRYMDSYTTKFIAISDAIKRYYVSIGIAEKKIKQIYNGIDNTKILKADFDNKNYNNKLKIIFAGGITESKGQMHALIALSKLQNQVKNNISIDFYGVADSTYLKLMQEFIQKNDLCRNVKIQSHVDNIYSILKDYDIGLMCSKSEAFGRITVEYMVSGLITIASNTGANNEIINDGIDGYLYDYNNIDSLHDKILYIYNNISNLNQVRRNAIKKVENNFTFKINAKNIYDLYNTV